MKKLLLLSVIFATVAIPVRAARLPNPRQGFKKALWHMVALGRAARGTTHARRAVVLFILICFQAMIGIVTLLTQVHLHTALMHQGMALVVLGFAIAHWRGFVGEYPRETVVKALN